MSSNSGPLTIKTRFIACTNAGLPKTTSFTPFLTYSYVLLTVQIYINIVRMIEETQETGEPFQQTI